ncbi:SphA family protein [Aquabacterium sp. OR-4]|uniref:SphA family protein n=1 Tax=Aquabacterium sp. OR-4 TaxID=2978127 RepID=UPI0021B4919F|nr:transporter [Aquabacterium sp. OR-4]MDT7837038.1 transporter [Aquabacterium sp. OR-4]
MQFQMQAGVRARAAVQLATVALIGWLATGAAQATENGLTSAAAGAEGFTAGALPPPGSYGLVYLNHYQSTRFNNGAGDSAVPGFKVTADAVVGRFVQVLPTQVLGGNLGWHVIVPLARVKLSAAGNSDSRSGVGDIEAGPFVAWHTPTFHYVAALDVVLPTGAYDKNRGVNLGHHYTTWRPIVGFSYLTPQLDVSAKITYSINGRNGDTDYRSGQYLHADWNLGFHVAPGWQLGLQGSLIHQTTDDQAGGATVADGVRTKVMAFGPAVRYQSPAGWSLEARVLKESGARWHTQGTAAWLKAVFAF